VQVKYEMLGRVQSEGHAVSHSAAISGSPAPRSTKRRLRSSREVCRALRPQKRGPKKTHKLTAEVLALVRQTQQQDPSLRPRAKRSSVELCSLAGAAPLQGVQFCPTRNGLPIRTAPLPSMTLFQLRSIGLHSSQLTSRNCSIECAAQAGFIRYPERDWRQCNMERPSRDNGSRTTQIDCKVLWQVYSPL
jgi:hypothetical protein